LTLQGHSLHLGGDTGPREGQPERLVRIAFLGTPLYEEPNEGSPKLAYLNKGTVLGTLDEQDGFLHVRTDDGAEGYVRRRSVARGAA
jgi:hypothetical protein